MVTIGLPLQRPRHVITRNCRYVSLQAAISGWPVDLADILDRGDDLTALPGAWLSMKFGICGECWRSLPLLIGRVVTIGIRTVNSALTCRKA
jgi:hypothetical protein